MGLGRWATERARLTTITMPEAGIEELASVWSGDGALFDALAAADLDADWTSQQIRKRAERTLLGRLRPQLAQLPATVDQWRGYLPVTSTTERRVAAAPRGGVSWTQTVRRFGWPPSQYVGRIRQRSADEMALTTLAWLSGRLSATLAHVASPAAFSPSLVAEVTGPIEVLREVVQSVMPDTAALRPERPDLLSLFSSGYPWRAVAEAAQLVDRFESKPSFLAFELVKAEPDLAWRLFHLAVFGCLIAALRKQQFRIRWNSPLAPGFDGPQAAAQSPDGTQWDIWFESSGMRQAYGVGHGPYPRALASIKGVGGPIGADVALVDRGARALLLECKWSDKSDYVGRDGYHQASSYALDARSGIVDRVWVFVVGPVEVVPFTSTAIEPSETLNVVLGSTSAPSVDNVVGAFLADDPLLLRGAQS
jgi:hypothetical protein